MSGVRFILCLTGLALTFATATGQTLAADEAGSELQLKEETRRSNRKMAFRFDGQRTLDGYMIGVESFDVRVSGFVVRVPIEVVDSVRFSNDFGNDSTVRLSNGDTLRGLITKFDFEMVTDWGRVNVTRPALTMITTIKTPPATSANGNGDSTARQRLPAEQHLPPSRTPSNAPVEIDLPEHAPPTSSDRVIMEPPTRYFAQ